VPDLAWAAGLLQNLSVLWGAATPTERRQIAHTLLNAVYLDADRGPVMAIAPKPEFALLFALAAEGLTGATAGGTVILAPGAELEQGES